MRKVTVRIILDSFVVLCAFLGLLSAWLVVTLWQEYRGPEPAAPGEGRYVETRHGRIFVQAQGAASGQPVIFVHGTAAWSGFWRQTSSRVGQAGFQAVAIDLPPFGFSDRDRAGRYRRTDQAKRLVGLVEALGPVRPIIVGHSFGAGPVLEAVMSRPDLFAGLVVVAGALGLPSEDANVTVQPGLLDLALAQPLVAQIVIAATATNPWLTRYFLSTMVHRQDTATEPVAEVLRKPLRRSGTTAAYAQWLPSLFADEGHARSGRPDNLRQLKVPTAVIWGREDSLTPLPQGERIAALIPGASLDVLDQVGHIPHLEAPDAFETVLLDRLNAMTLQR